MKHGSSLPKVGTNAFMKFIAWIFITTGLKSAAKFDSGDSLYYQCSSVCSADSFY